MKKTVLITGSNGFIGTNLISALKGYHVITWDLQDGNDIFDHEFEDQVKKVDVVIHLAAKTSVSESFKNPAETYRVNVLGTARVVELCERYSAKLIYPSSAAIYHPELSPYANSKWLAEQIVNHMKPKVKTVVFRFFNIFGPHMNPESGSIMYNFLTADDIIVYGDGEQTRDYIHIRDVVSLIKSAIEYERWESATVDVGTGMAYSVNYVAGLFAHFRKKKVIYEPPKREIKWSIANTDFLKRMYESPLTTNLQKDIKELCKAK